MTHNPRVPPGNTSPYPLSEAPHAKKIAPPIAERPAHENDTLASKGYSAWLYVGALAAVGVIASLTLALSGTIQKSAPKTASGRKLRKARNSPN